MHKLVWSKGTQDENGIWRNSGWKKVLIPQEEEKYHKAKENFDISEDLKIMSNNELDIFQKVQNEIQIGTDKNRIDELPNSVKQILFSSDEWYLSKSNKLYRVKDPITQALDGDYGIDLDEVDDDNKKERTSTTRAFLEQSGILQPEECPIKVSDILGNIEVSDELPLSETTGPIVRSNADIELVGVTEECVMADDLSSDDSPEFGVEVNDDEYFLKDPRMNNTALPNLPKYIMDRVNDITKDFQSKLKLSKSEEEATELQLAYENAVDKQINPFLTYSINSPFCGRGYAAPKRQQDQIYIPQSSEIIEAADERKDFFIKLFKEASDCSSYQELFGKNNSGGFYGKIRQLNGADRELSNEWSITDKLDKDGNLVEYSALKKAKHEYIRNWRHENRGDEEKLRKSVWVLFDREAGEIPEQRNSKGEIVSPKTKWKDSIWKQRRSKALQGLSLTIKQWDAIYKMLAIVKNRIKLNNADSDNRKKAIEILKNKFVEVQTIHDLNEYMQWAETRKFVYTDGQSGNRKLRDGSIVPIMKGIKRNTYKFKPAIIDHLSIIDEMIWRKSCANKRGYLKQRIFLFKAIDEVVKEIIDTNLEETSVSCYNPECDSMTIGKPKFAITNENKGYLFVDCEECGSKIWLIEYKEKAIPRTLEEAIGKINNEN